MSHRPHRARLTTLAAVMLSGGAASAALAQSTPAPPSNAPVQGVVVDEVTFQPVDSAVVKIVGTDVSVPTDRWGGFALPDLRPGPVSLQVSAPGHPSIVYDVDVREGRIVFVQIAMPSVSAVLAGLVVSGAPRNHANEGVRTAADLLALEVPRTRVNPGAVGRSDMEVRLRPGSTFQSIGAPMVLVDGVLLSNGEGAFEALERIPASDVEEIQVLKGPTAAFIYPYAANGVINVLTKRGGGGR